MKESIKKEILDFAEYCSEIWCEWYEGNIDDKNTLRIVSDNSKWVIHLNDFNKFHSYILWHYSSNIGDDKYHRQKSNQNIFYLIAEAISHDIYLLVLFLSSCAPTLYFSTYSMGNFGRFTTVFFC